MTLTFDSLRYDMAEMPALWVVVGLVVATVVAIIGQSIIAVTPRAPRQTRILGRVVWKGMAGLSVLAALAVFVFWGRFE